MQNAEPLKRADRIIEFEGLRGCLAWWVVLYHFVLRSKIDPSALNWFERRVAYNGWEAVPVFIILSGFVITWLLDTQHESYGVFLVRRFFRLAPVYYVLLGYATVVAYLHGNYGDALWKHLVMHLSFLHGMVPDEILMKSDTALCIPAWSLSVEWQFYLVAALVLPVIRRSASKAMLLLIGSIVLSKILLRVGTFEFHAWTIMHAGMFGYGIGSYYFYQAVITRSHLSPTFVRNMLPAGFALAWVFLKSPEIGLLWFLVLTAVLSRRLGVETLWTRPLTFLLNRPLVVWLGKLSYCTYLCHDYVLDLITATFGRHLSTLNDRLHLLIYMTICTPLILGLSMALHYLVENPGIRLGKKATKSWLNKEKLAAAALPEINFSTVHVATLDEPMVYDRKTERASVEK